MNEYLNKINVCIEKHLNKYFNENDPMKNICFVSLKNGKKIRPSISFDICNSLLNSTENIEFPSLVVEYLHIASLIIDDLPCMDNAQTRRNELANHVKYGEAVTQLTSVILVSLAMDSLTYGIDVILENNKTEKNTELMKIGLVAFGNLSRIIGNSGVAGGQLLDLAFTKPDIKKLYTNPIDLKDMILKKTGAFFELSFIIGWLFGKGNIDKIDKIKEISEHFSMIYQIVDDFEDTEEDNPNKDKITKNYVLNNGKENSIKDCNEHLEKFKLGLKELNLESNFFFELIKYLEDKLNLFK